MHLLLTYFCIAYVKYYWGSCFIWWEWIFILFFCIAQKKSNKRKTLGKPELQHALL